MTQLNVTEKILNVDTQNIFRIFDDDDVRILTMHMLNIFLLLGVSFSRFGVFFPANE